MQTVGRDPDAIDRYRACWASSSETFVENELKVAPSRARRESHLMSALKAVSAVQEGAATSKSLILLVPRLSWQWKMYPSTCVDFRKWRFKAESVP